MSKERIVFFTKSFGDGYNNSGVYDAAIYTAQFLESLNLDDRSGRAYTFSCNVYPVKDEEELCGVVKTLNPSMVIIEGIWADPEKIKAINNITYVRSHSQWSFMGEDATRLIFEYKKRNVGIIFNDLETYEVFNCVGSRSFMSPNLCVYLPNLFPMYSNAVSLNYHPFNCYQETVPFRIGMFGELRPMKNHLMQVMAVRRFAAWLYEGYGVKTELNINTSFDTDPVLSSIRHIVANASDYLSLKEHFWLHGHEFNSVIQNMNLGLQVSFTETFNLTSARFVCNDVPVIASKAVKWLPKKYTVDAHSPEQLFDLMIKFPVPQYSFFGFDIINYAT